MLAKKAFLVVSLVFSHILNSYGFSYEKAKNLISSGVLAIIPAVIAKKISTRFDTNEFYYDDHNVKHNNYFKFSNCSSLITYITSTALLYHKFFLPKSFEISWENTRTKIASESELLKRLPIFIKKSNESLIEEITEYYIDQKLPLVHAVNSLVELKNNSLKAIALSNQLKDKVDNPNYKIIKLYRDKAFGNLLTASTVFVEQFNQEYFDNINKIILTIKKSKEYLKQVKIDNDFAIANNPNNQRELLDQFKTLKYTTLIAPVMLVAWGILEATK